jgi:alpha,alpha-trehalose phosphorylase
VQAIVAEDIGYHDLALEYFHRSLYLDLSDSHGNSNQGVHIASCGGVWAGVVHGFAGMVERGDFVEFSPYLPRSWESISFHLRRHGSLMRVDVDHEGATVTVIDGRGVPVRGQSGIVHVAPDEQLRIATAVVEGRVPDDRPVSESARR